MSIRIVDGGSVWRNITAARVVDSGGTWRNIESGVVATDAGTWQNFFVYDRTGPTAVTSQSAEWTRTSGNRCVVGWNNPNVSDFSYVQLYRYKSNSVLTTSQLAALSSGSWTLLVSAGGSPGMRVSYSDAVSTGDFSSYTVHGPSNSRTNIHYYRFIPYDTRGNSGTPAYASSVGSGTTVVRGMYSSPYNLAATDGGTYRDGSWRNVSQTQDGSGTYTRAGQARFDTSLGYNYGFWFYGSKPASGSIDVTSAQILMGRWSAGNNVGIPPYFRLSSHSSRSGDPTASTFSTSVTTGTSMKWNEAFSMSFPASWAEFIIQNTTYRSLNIYRETTADYAIFYGSGDVNSNGLPYGSLILTHNG